jgi:predicted O-methyltransferase YrrM
VNRDETIRQCYQVPGQTWPTELGWLYDTISQSKSHAEIGTYCGRSLLASCAGMQPGASVVSVDDESIWQNKEWTKTVQQATFDLLPDHVSVKRFAMHSQDAARECHRTGLRFDSVFIDADHNYAECRADIEAWQSLLNAGGLLCGHDYWTQDVGVMDAVNEVLKGKHTVIPGTRIWTFHKLI